MIEIWKRFGNLKKRIGYCDKFWNLKKIGNLEKILKFWNLENSFKFELNWNLKKKKGIRDAFKKKKVNFGTSAQKGGRGQSQIPNVDQYWIWDIYVRGEGVLRSMSQYCIWFFSYIECSTCPMSTVFIGASL